MARKVKTPTPAKKPLELYTTGDIARLLNTGKDRVLYAIKSRKIVPTATAGGYRLFDRASADLIKDAMAG